MHAKTNPRIHLCASNIFASPFMDQEGLYFGSGIQNDAHILADVAREKAAMKSAAGISKMMCRHRSDYRSCIVTGALEKKTQAVHIFAFIAATAVV
jgi:hypothetical protein